MTASGTPITLQNIGPALAPKRVHLIGIGGSGLSAIAQVLLERGYTVSGSDQTLGPLARELARMGAKVSEGHQAAYVRGADLVVRSSAIPDDNPEVIAARAAGIPVLKRADFVAQLMSGQTVIAVGGTHGKTTTTAMVAWLLSRLGQDPSYIIGGVSRNLSGNAHAGQGSHFVIEADEYDRMFLGLSPSWILLTYLEHDHPDCYPTLEEYRQAFRDFIQRLLPGGGLLACSDCAETAALARQVPAGCHSWTYGLTPDADYTSFSAWYHAPAQPPVLLAQMDLQVPGRHNAQNALAALALAHRLGLPVAAAASALTEFSGTGRRFEQVGEAGGVTIYNDYAHHPTEIRATLAAARQRYPDRRIWAVWQPHTYSRTQILLNEFSQAFSDADLVVVTEIYAAREANNGFSSSQVVEAMTHPGQGPQNRDPLRNGGFAKRYPRQGAKRYPAVQFAPTLAAATQLLLGQLHPGDVVFVLSAGDADQISQQVLDTLRFGEEHHERK
jgi:UDP-N-acetylmuramate--alanine ligase